MSSNIPIDVFSQLSPDVLPSLLDLKRSESIASNLSDEIASFIPDDPLDLKVLESVISNLDIMRQRSLEGAIDRTMGPGGFEGSVPPLPHEIHEGIPDTSIRRPSSVPPGSHLSQVPSHDHVSHVAHFDQSTKPLQLANSNIDLLDSINHIPHLGGVSQNTRSPNIHSQNDHDIYDVKHSLTQMPPPLAMETTGSHNVLAELEIHPDKLRDSTTGDYRPVYSCIRPIVCHKTNTPFYAQCSTAKTGFCTWCQSLRPGNQKQGSICLNCGERLTAKYHRWYPYLVRLEPLEKERTIETYRLYKPVFEKFGITWTDDRQLEFVVQHYMLMKIYLSSPNVDVEPLHLERAYMVGVFAGREFNTGALARKLLREGCHLAMFRADFPEFFELLREERASVAEQMNQVLFGGVNRAYFHAHHTNIEGWYDPTIVSRDCIVQLFKDLCNRVLCAASHVNSPNKETNGNMNGNINGINNVNNVDGNMQPVLPHVARFTPSYGASSNQVNNVNHVNHVSQMNQVTPNVPMNQFQTVPNTSFATTATTLSPTFGHLGYGNVYAPSFVGSPIISPPVSPTFTQGNYSMQSAFSFPPTQSSFVPMFHNGTAGLTPTATTPPGAYSVPGYFPVS